ncbi:MAG: DUF4827 domain-containing protein [Paramuribaculum sp.]|nr:DUF4827 domain-containing protein [Paramuribaculum sp.]
MNRFTSLILRAVGVIFLPALFFAVSSCSDDKSYTDLLNTESKYVNNFLADQKVITTIPSDTVFQTGKDAPYYMLDDEGRVFMQVIDPGFGPKVTDNEMVYFRYMRYPLSAYVPGETLVADSGNENVGYESTFFRYGNTSLSSTTQWGTGIQMPLRYLPLNSTVNLVIKAEFGFTADLGYVQPYLFNVRYFPARN